MNVENEHWQNKVRRSAKISNGRIDHLYEVAKNNGALGEKIMGAGGGFFMLYCPVNRKVRLRRALSEAGRSRLRGSKGAGEFLTDREIIVMSYTTAYLAETSQILAELDVSAIERLVILLVDLRERGGRLFILGVGGGAGHASHAVNDFHKITDIESYAPTDNVSELTARVNDDGWESVFANWLKVSRLNRKDMLLVFSVGGGDTDHNISPNLVRALYYGKEVQATICGVVGRNGGYTAKVADACVIVPTVNRRTVTPHTEACQAVIWHLLVSHPILCSASTKWESVQK